MGAGSVSRARQRGFNGRQTDLEQSAIFVLDYSAFEKLRRERRLRPKTRPGERSAAGRGSRPKHKGGSMKRRDFVKLCGSSLATAAVGAPFVATAQDKVVWKASDVHPLGYTTVEAVQRMGKKLETATNGRISIQMVPSMQLGGEKEMMGGAQVGALQIARISV